MMQYTFVLCLALATLGSGDQVVPRSGDISTHFLQNSVHHANSSLEVRDQPSNWEKLLDFIKDNLPTYNLADYWATAVDKVIKLYLEKHELTDLTDECVVLKDLVLILDIFFEVLFNREITLSNLPTLPIVIDGGSIADIELDAVLKIAIDKLNITDCVYPYESNEKIRNSDAKLLRSTILLSNVDASLTNYDAKGTVGTTLKIDSTGDARINFQNFKINLEVNTEPKWNHVIKPDSYTMDISAETARVIFVPDGKGNHDVATYMNEYLSMHIFDVIELIQALLNIEGTGTYNSIMTGLDYLSQGIRAIMILNEDKILCEVVYDRLGCYDVRDSPKKGKPVDLSDLEMCILQLLEIGPVDVLKLIVNSKVRDLLPQNEVVSNGLKD